MKNKIKKIAIYCELDQNSGLGHLKRMEALYLEFKKLNHDCFFIFNSKKKKFFKKYFSNFKILYFISKKKDDLHEIIRVLKKEEVGIIILDSYSMPVSWEAELVKSKIFVVSIDDHLKKHYSNIVVTNKVSLGEKIVVNKNQIWLNGLKYLLVKKLSKSFRLKKQTNNFNVLLHAGGSSNFRYIKKLAERTIIACLKYNFKLTVLCTNFFSKKYILDLSKKLNISKNINFINYNSNFSQNLKKYEIVVGPAGTTTFETIQSGAIPFTSSLKNDGRDDDITWYSVGHLMHLNEKEKKNTQIIDECWEILIKKYKNLSAVLKKNSKKIDGLGPKRLAKEILSLEKNRIKIKIKKNKSNDLSSSLAKTEHIRIFLNSRNYKKTREASSNPNHIISWPEHINWWLNSNVLKNSVIHNNKPIAFHWSKKIQNKQKSFLISGWFLNKNINNDLNLAYKVLNFQFNSIKKKYRNIVWIAVMKRENKFVERLNKKFGFKDATDVSKKLIFNIFNNKKKDLNAMEIKL